MAERHKAEAVLVAIPSAGAQMLAELADLAGEANLTVKVLPPVKDLFGGDIGLGDIRDIDVKDLLGRHQVETDLASIAGVRFGNVLVSSGSVLTTFHAQLKAGGPLTVTHRDVTRYFMTVEEAVELVIQAGAIGRAGEALVLDMGAPVRIAEVAQRMAAQAKRPTRVVYTGLRTGEKLHEVLLGAREADERPIQPAISHVAVPSLDPLDVRTLDPWVPTSELIETMRYLCVDEVVPAAASSTWRYG